MPLYKSLHEPRRQTPSTTKSMDSRFKKMVVWRFMWYELSFEYHLILIVVFDVDHETPCIMAGGRYGLALDGRRGVRE